MGGRRLWREYSRGVPVERVSLAGGSAGRAAGLVGGQRQGIVGGQRLGHHRQRGGGRSLDRACMVAVQLRLPRPHRDRRGDDDGAQGRLGVRLRQGHEYPDRLPPLRQGVALHFTGSAWRVLPLPAGLLPARRTILPEQMLAESPTSVWGTVYAASGSSRGPVLLVHWKGPVWRRGTGRLPAGSLTGPIAPDGQGGLWLCGEGPGGAGFLAHYRGGQWTQGPAPAAALSVTALTLIPGTATLWGAGTTGEGFGTSKGAVILRYGR